MEYKWNKKMNKVNLIYQNNYYTLSFKRYHKDMGYFLNNEISKIIPCKEKTYMELYDFETDKFYNSSSDTVILSQINLFQNSTNQDKIVKSEDGIEIYVKDSIIKFKIGEFKQNKKLCLNRDIFKLVNAFDALLVIYHNTNLYIKQFELFLNETFLYMMNFINKIFNN